MRNIFPAACIFLFAIPLRAQSTGGNPAPGRALQETGRVLKEAQSNGKSDAARQAAVRSADNGQFDQLAAEAKTKLAKSPGNEDRKMIDALEQKLAPALRNAEPEGRAIIAQSAAAPALRAPEPDAPAGSSPGKKPPGTKTADGKTGKPGEAPPKDIDIRSEDAVYLTNTDQMAIFTGDVVLDHPQFHMTSDKLEVYFKKQADPPPPGKAGADADILAKPGADAKPGTPPPTPASGDAKLDHAVATGRKVVIRKLDEKGELQIGLCRKATYYGDSGDILLNDMPQVQRGNNVIMARDSSTYMVLKQNGELKVHGPANTKIEQATAGGSKPPAAAPIAAPIAAPVAAPAGVPKPSGSAPGAPTLTPKKPAKK